MRSGRCIITIVILGAALAAFAGADAVAARQRPHRTGAVPAVAHWQRDLGPSGVPMPTGNPHGWHRVFADDFRTDVPVGGFSHCVGGQTLMRSHCSGLPRAVAAKWWAYPDGWKDTMHTGEYFPSQVMSIEDGMMILHLHTADGIHMVAAPVPKIPGGVHGWGLRYGRYEVRFRADSLPGYKTAWLLWPDSEKWPHDGEIDFPEGDLDGTIGAYMHLMNATSDDRWDFYSTGTTYGAWHTAVLEWTPHYCRFMLDGHIVGTARKRIPSTPMHWVLQTETSTDGPPPADTTAGNVEIAWVVAYKRDRRQ